jgi:hypothetical protein
MTMIDGMNQLPNRQRKVWPRLEEFAGRRLGISSIRVQKGPKEPRVRVMVFTGPDGETIASSSSVREPADAPSDGYRPIKSSDLSYPIIVEALQAAGILDSGPERIEDWGSPDGPLVLPL